MNDYFYFLNRRNSGDGFREAQNSDFFVDKSLLIEEINGKISTKEKWICVSRPRRFGKTMALEMLAAYYTKGIDSDELFQGLKIKEQDDYDKHLNEHNVIVVNFNDYFNDSMTVKQGIELLSKRLIQDLEKAFPEAGSEEDDITLYLDMVNQVTGEKFIFLIDEWDSLLRFRKGDSAQQEEFLNFLRLLFKDKSYVELVYMTGILPIKKYNTGSALNMFREFTMLQPKKLAPYFGFTEDEVKALCKQNNRITAEEMREWYDGYYMRGVGDIYNPRSVVEALEENICQDYWNKTGGFSELEEYITLDFDGLGSDITRLVAQESIQVDVLGFSNDLDSFQDKDEVITALIHLGYLTYKEGYVRIPNKEISEEFASTVKKLSLGIVSDLLRKSRKLLEATYRKDGETVALLLENVHDDMKEFKEYSNEQTLKCVIHLAYYAAADDFVMKFEEPAGKGIADCVMYPRKKSLPGIVIELKYNKSPEEAVEQIRKRDYVKALEQCVNKVLLVGINYDKLSKKHQCVIEELN